MTDHLIGRNVPIPDTAEPNQRFETLATTFEARWLTLQEKNPLQELWARQDYMTSIELAWLGDGMQRMSAADEEWTKREAKKIKTGDPTNRSGALFEVLALSLFCGQGQTVKPMPKGNPGYDGIVEVEGRLPVHLSIKNYGTSEHEKHVRKKAALLEAKVVQSLEREITTGCSIRLLTEAHPDAEAWREIEEGIEQAITRSVADHTAVTVGNHWNLKAQAIPAEFGSFSSSNLSYQFILVVPHHANESKNMISKLDEGCANFRKHAGEEQGDVARAIIIRLPPSASTDLCAEWTRDYFLTSDDVLDGIILYQPGVVMNGEAIALAHHFIQVSNPKTEGRPSGAAFGGLQGSVYVGDIVSQPVELFLTDGDLKIPLRGRYAYQRGDIYTVFEEEPGDVRLLAPGMKQHAIIKKDGAEELLQGKFPPTHELLLLP